MVRPLHASAAAYRAGIAAYCTRALALNDSPRARKLPTSRFVRHAFAFLRAHFRFTLNCPDDYPNSPPKCKLMTTGGGAVRFNPNLYANGKVVYLTAPYQAMHLFSMHLISQPPPPMSPCACASACTLCVGLGRCACPS